MKKRQTNPLIFLVISIILMLIFPYILQITYVRNLVSDWLSFSDNSDYKIAYIHLIGSIVGTFLSVYGALLVQKEQQKSEEEKKRRACVRNIYIELNTCLNELQNIFTDTKLVHKIDRIEKEDIKNFCIIAKGRKLNISERWVENLAGAGNALETIDINMIYKYYYKLQIIQQAFESENIEEIQNIYVPYVCWFITTDGKGLHNDVKGFMKKLEEIIRT